MIYEGFGKAIAQALADDVRKGLGLRHAILAAGLPLKETLRYLQKNHRQLFLDAKREQKDK